MSGWSVMTVHPSSSLSQSATERAYELIEDYLEGYDASPYDEPADGYADLTVQCGDERSRGEDAAFEHAQKVFDECPAADEIVFTIVGDTSDSGSAWYFKVDKFDGEADLIDHFEGYEGARGRDAIGYIQEEHGVEGYVSYEA